MSTIVDDCLRLLSVYDESLPLQRGPKGPQKCTIVDDSAQIAESGLKTAFESPQLDFPETQEPLNAPFLNGLFSSGFSRGKTAPYDEIGETPH